MASMLVLYGIMGATILLLIRLSGNRPWTGIASGISLGGLWLIGFFEPWARLGTSPLTELIMGLNDSLPIALMGLLLGLQSEEKGSRRDNKAVPAFLPVIMAISFIIGRYFLYLVVKIDSGLAGRPLETLAWTALLGAWIGFAYKLILRRASRPGGKTMPAFLFACVFGITWIPFNLFMPMVFRMDAMDFLVRSAGDTLFVCLGAIASDFIGR